MTQYSLTNPTALTLDPGTGSYTDGRDHRLITVR